MTEEEKKEIEEIEEKEIEVDFNNLVDKYLSREYRPKAVGRYYPSEIGSCLRKIWYSYKNPKETKAELIRIFEAGNILHDFVVDVLKSEKNPEVELLESELPVQMKVSDFLISGRIDDLMLIKLSNRKVLVEVKSTKSIKFTQEPHPQHAMQLMFYMHATGVHDGMLIYIEKNTLQTKWFEVDYNEENAQEIEKRFGKLHEALTENKIPEQEAKIKGVNWMCKFCDYSEECEKAGK